MPEGIILLSAGSDIFPTKLLSISTGSALLPKEIISIPIGMAAFPAVTTPLPDGKMTFPAGKTAFSTGKNRNQFRISNLLFCWNRRGWGWRRGCGRIGCAVIAHLAADVLELFGSGRAFAQQSGHGINHAAGVVISTIGRGLQIGGGLDVGHFRFLLDGCERVDRPQLALQAGDMRRNVEVFRLQGRLVVGILHVGDGLSDNA